MSCQITLENGLVLDGNVSHLMLKVSNLFSLICSRFIFLKAET